MFKSLSLLGVLFLLFTFLIAFDIISFNLKENYMIKNKYYLIYDENIKKPKKIALLSAHLCQTSRVRDCRRLKTAMRYRTYKIYNESSFSYLCVSKFNTW